MNKKIVGGAALTKENIEEGHKYISDLQDFQMKHGIFGDSFITNIGRCLSMLTSNLDDMTKIIDDYSQTRQQIYNFAYNIIITNRIISSEMLTIINPIFMFLETKETIVFNSIKFGRRPSLVNLYYNLLRKYETYKQEQQPPAPPTSVVAPATSVVAPATSVVAPATSEVAPATSEVAPATSVVVKSPTNVSSNKNQSRTINLNGSLLENSTA